LRQQEHYQHPRLKVVVCQKVKTLVEKFKISYDSQCKSILVRVREISHRLSPINNFNTMILKEATSLAEKKDKDLLR